MNFKDVPQFTRTGSWECDYDLEGFVTEIERLEAGKYKNDAKLELNPDFQRGHVWTEEQQIKYVEFILKGGKTGRVIYLNHPGWRDDYKITDIGFVCADGLQRITALKKFIHNELKVFGTYYNQFEGHITLVNGMKININDLKSRKEVLQWYLEMNSGGTPHTEEEINKVKKMLEE